MARPVFLGLLLTAGLAAHLAPAPAAATTGLAFLSLGSSARTAALAEAVTAVMDGEAGSYNPAALAGNRTVSLTHGEWVQDIRHDYLTAVWQRGASTLAGAVQVSQADGLERRTGPADTPLGEFGVYEWAAGLTWARPVASRMRLGGTARFVRQSIYDQAASGAAADVGALYEVSPALSLGAAVRHLGLVTDLDREATELPLQVRAGAAYRPEPRVLLAGDVQWTRGAATSLHLGAEGRVGGRLLLRAGYQTADGRDLSLGLGLRGRAWALDYAYVPLASGLGEGHRLSLSFSRPDPLR